MERKQVEVQRRRRAGGEARVARAQVEKGGWPNMTWRHHTFHVVTLSVTLRGWESKEGL